VTRQPIAFEDFSIHAQRLWGRTWLLLTAGDFAAGDYNTMTVGWGSFGVMWNLPFAQVGGRPTRHTFSFTGRYDTFTLCAFGEEHRPALQLLGTRSGRDGDKITPAGLTPVAATQVAAPAFEQAELVVECRKIYWDDLDSEHFLDPNIESNYPKQDYHRVYFGEILAISGTADYR